MSSILVVEDDPDIAELIAHFLEKAGHDVKRLTSGTSVIAELRAAPADLVILDLMLPGMDGLLVCQAMRADSATAAIPIIMLTARGDEADRIAGLELGADDYVTKPFSPKELVARVAARLRRQAAGVTTGVVQYGAISIDADRHIVTLDGAEVKLTAKEFLPDATTVGGDPAKLHDALRNLLENASTTRLKAAHRHVGRAPRWTCRAERLGFRPGDSRHGSATRVRTLLPRRQGPIARRARSGRHRPRSRHREAPDRAAWRKGEGGQSRSQRRNLHG